jgi:hypothetical protein
MTMWLIEGLPGVGKSTMAAHLCDIAREAGYKASWYLEESADHPVHPALLTARRRSGGDFIEDCLASWRQFADRSAGEDTVHILEGSAFQSTVRFLMEERLENIETYYARFQEVVAPTRPRMVYLRPADFLGHSEYVSRLRGGAWTEKVAGYLEKTRYSKSMGFAGVRGMHLFWADYAALCDELIARTTMPVKTVQFVPGDWMRHLTEAVEFLGLERCSSAEETKMNAAHCSNKRVP